MDTEKDRKPAEGEAPPAASAAYDATKIKVLEESATTSRFGRTLRASYAEGKLDPATFRFLLEAYHDEGKPTGGTSLG